MECFSREDLVERLSGIKASGGRTQKIQQSNLRDGDDEDDDGADDDDRPFINTNVQCNTRTLCTGNYDLYVLVKLSIFEKLNDDDMYNE